MTVPAKPGWYWILRTTEGSVPEVCFWTGASFLIITDSILKPEEVALCGDEPLKPPPDFPN